MVTWAVVVLGVVFVLGIVILVWIAIGSPRRRARGPRTVRVKLEGGPLRAIVHITEGSNSKRRKEGRAAGESS